MKDIMSETKTTVEISDLYLTAFLTTIEYNFSDSFLQDGKVLFIFPKTEKLKREIDDYISGTKPYTIIPIKFETKIKELKKLIFHKMKKAPRVEE